MAVDIYFETLALRPLSFQRKFDRNLEMSDQEKAYLHGVDQFIYLY